MTRAGRVAGALGLILGCAHSESPAPAPAAGDVHASSAAAAGLAAPLFDNLGSHHRAIATSSAEAQKYFDQGLNLLFGFNHDEAIRSFVRATQLDPECAMCFWGLAYANGPHINNPSLDPRHAKAAWDAIQRAQAPAAKASGVDKELIAALAKRYSADPAAERRPLDEAYAAAMREVWKRHPDDTDAGTLLAESMMDLRPWDLWTHDGKPQPGTEELVSVLETVLSKDPNHPGANHFYIHAVEASPHPERALAAAGRVGTLVPGAGHLVHMPSHVYIRVGRYADAAEANRRAIEADRAYRARAGPQGFYSMYMAHNFQFLWAADLWAGRSAEAAEAEAGMFKVLGLDMAMAMPEMMDLVLPYPYFRLVRFGRWDEILALPAPPPGMPLTDAMWHFARGMALGGKADPDGAAKELRALEAAVPALSDKAGATMNSARSLAAIALHVLEGDLASRRGRVAEAVRRFNAAVTVEDALNYNEPPDWVLPARHFLGQALLGAGRAKEAAAVYREDLKRNPENGWALAGLAKALALQQDPEGAAVEKRFAMAWASADVKLGGSRF